MFLKAGTKFKGNVNQVLFEIVREENNNFVIKAENGEIFNYGKQALEHCDITILEE